MHPLCCDGLPFNSFECFNLGDAVSPQPLVNLHGDSYCWTSERYCIVLSDDKSLNFKTSWTSLWAFGSYRVHPIGRILFYFCSLVVVCSHNVLLCEAFWPYALGLVESQLFCKSLIVRHKTINYSVVYSQRLGCPACLRLRFPPTICFNRIRQSAYSVASSEPPSTPFFTLSCWSALAKILILSFQWLGLFRIVQHFSLFRTAFLPRPTLFGQRCHWMLCVGLLFETSPWPQPHSPVHLLLGLITFNCI